MANRRKKVTWILPLPLGDRPEQFVAPTKCIASIGLHTPKLSSNFPQTFPQEKVGLGNVSGKFGGNLCHIYNLRADAMQYIWSAPFPHIHGQFEPNKKNNCCFVDFYFETDFSKCQETNFEWGEVARIEQEDTFLTLRTILGFS